ncbi:MAG: response regulator [bacterium]|nr:response regulator [bacterium]
MAKKVLVIDDQLFILRVIENKLKSGGLEVITAVDGVEGLKKAFEEKPDLIITDIMMPNLDGFGVYQELQKNPQTKKIPIIFLTAMGEEREELKELGPVAVITKPFSPRQMLNTVNSMLNLPLN